MKKPDHNRIVLTGGHAATTAIAVIEEIRAQGKDWKLYWIGVKNAIEGKKVVTLESEVLPRLGVKFLNITTGRIQRKFTFWTIPSIFKLPIGLLQSLYYLFKIRPKCVLSFGGFASFPVVVNAKLLGIPVIIHEQTSVAGRANLAVSKFASIVTLSRNESVKYFKNIKSVVIGNPVMRKILEIKPVGKKKEDFVIFITGGSRGSQSINLAVEQILKTLLKKFKVIHQTGGLDYLKFSNLKQKFPAALRNNYEVFIRINPLEINKIYSKSSLIISRSGANTVSEIMVTGRPAILIPLPISYLNEQYKNAVIAKSFGVAKIIEQRNLTPKILLKNILDTYMNYDAIVSKLKTKKSPDVGSSGKLVSIIEKYMQ